MRPLLLIMLAGLFSLIEATAYGQVNQKWRIVQGAAPSEEHLTKLLYSDKDNTKADLYFRCQVDEGWIFLIHDYTPKTGNPPFLLRAGDLQLMPSFKVDHDEIDDNFYIDAAIPADHRIFELMAEGIPLLVEGSSYRASSEPEKRAIKTFIKICDGS